jgi:S-adenosylmethionine:tRNA ribosyltransferase-isomerase
MKIEEFDYHLPREMIAQEPAQDRSASRMLVLHRGDGTIEHRLFGDVVEYLHAGDVLVLNDTKVLPARLKARKQTGGAVNILLVERIDASKWNCLVDGASKGSNEVEVTVGENKARLVRTGPYWEVEFLGASADEVMARHGKMPLPNYIKRGENGKGSIDVERYQTVYAEQLGSIAAPTAGLHFTDELLTRISGNGVQIVKVTLHIGVGTFFLVKTENVEDHKMHREYYTVHPEVMSVIRSAKDGGARVFGVGTSAVRTLESVWSTNGAKPLAGYTELFMHPGYGFNATDCLITNFHLPRSTPLLLACAFAGKANIVRAYREAVDQGYRFYSYGDSMLVL